MGEGNQNLFTWTVIKNTWEFQLIGSNFQAILHRRDWNCFLSLFSSWIFHSPRCSPANFLLWTVYHFLRLLACCTLSKDVLKLASHFHVSTFVFKTANTLNSLFKSTSSDYNQTAQRNSESISVPPKATQLRQDQTRAWPLPLTWQPISVFKPKILNSILQK